jgi:hypothetical protein
MTYQYEMGLIRTDRGLFIDKGNQVYDVRHPDFAGGAKGDGVANDTAAIQAAIAMALAAGNGGAVVFLPAGTYKVSEDIDVPEGVVLNGAGVETVIIRWDISAGDPANAVITSNLDGAYGLTSGIWVKNLRLDCNGADNGILLRGWNEFCGMENVDVFNATEESVRLEGVTSSTFPCHQATFRSVRACPEDSATAKGFVFNDIERCTFVNLTVDQDSAASNPVLVGIELEAGCFMNVFLDTHLEDCTRPLDMGTVGQVYLNMFYGLNFTAPHQTPASSTVGSYSGTMAVVNRTGSQAFELRGVRDLHGYDYLVVVPDESFTLASSAGRRRQYIVLSEAPHIETDVPADLISTPAALSAGDNNNVSTGMYKVLRLAGDSGGTSVISGFADNHYDGRTFRVINVSAYNFDIQHQDASSGAVNRVISPTGASVTLQPDDVVELMRDETTDRWRIVDITA